MNYYMSNLNSTLKDKIKETVNSLLLGKIPMFSENFSQTLIEKLAVNCEEKVFSDGDIIIKVLFKIQN